MLKLIRDDTPFFYQNQREITFSGNIVYGETTILKICSLDEQSVIIGSKPKVQKISACDGIRHRTKLVEGSEIALPNNHKLKLVRFSENQANLELISPYWKNEFKLFPKQNQIDLRMENTGFLALEGTFDEKGLEISYNCILTSR